MKRKYIEFGTYLRRKRQDLGLKQTEVAEKLNCTNQLICNWESGNSRPSMRLLSMLQKLLKLNKKEMISKYIEQEKEVLLKMLD